MEDIEHNGLIYDITTSETNPAPPATSVECAAFTGCEGIKTIILPNGEALEKNKKAFVGYNEELQEFQVRDTASDIVTIDGIVYSKDCKTLICCPPNKSQVVVPNGVEVIGDYAFYGSKVREVILPDSIHTIGASAFSGCYQLEEMVLPVNLKAIGEGCFEHCEKLVLNTLPVGLKNIPFKGFFKCPLANNQILSHIVTIDTCGFQGSNFEKLHIPGNVLSIGWDAFKECHKLTHLVIDEGTETLKTGAFCNNYELKEIVLPSSIKQVGQGVFSMCPKIVSVVLYAVIPPDNSQMKDDWRLFTNDSINLYVPAQSVERYKCHPVWGKISNILPI